MFCGAIYPFKTTVKELNTDAALFEVERPCACAAGGCKCCCYQELFVSSGGTKLGSIKENYYYCVPSFTIKDDKDQPQYILHPPTCCGGMCGTYRILCVSFVCTSSFLFLVSQHYLLRITLQSTAARKETPAAERDAARSPFGFSTPRTRARPTEVMPMWWVRLSRFPKVWGQKFSPMPMPLMSPSPKEPPRNKRR